MLKFLSPRTSRGSEEVSLETFRTTDADKRERVSVVVTRGKLLSGMDDGVLTAIKDRANRDYRAMHAPRIRNGGGLGAMIDNAVERARGYTGVGSFNEVGVIHAAVSAAQGQRRTDYLGGGWEQASLLAVLNRADQVDWVARIPQYEHAVVLAGASLLERCMYGEQPSGMSGALIFPRQ